MSGLVCPKLSRSGAARVSRFASTNGNTEALRLLCIGTRQ